jgi:peptidyl-prolyl cis-trans isomerase B (cyclophilin B)
MVGYPTQPDWQPAGQPQSVYVTAVPPTNGLAIASLILVFVFFPLGIILGHLARGQIKRTGEGGKGLATAALVIGYSPIIIAIVVFIGAAILVAFGAK